MKKRKENGSWGYGPVDGDTQLDWIAMELTPAVLRPIRKALKASNTAQWRPALHALVVLHAAGLLYDSQAVETAEMGLVRLADFEREVPQMGWAEEDSIYAQLDAEKQAVEALLLDLQGRGTGFGAHVGKVVEELGWASSGCGRIKRRLLR